MCDSEGLTAPAPSASARASGGDDICHCQYYTPTGLGTVPLSLLLLKVGRAPLSGSHRSFYRHIERPRTVDLLDLYVVRKLRLSDSEAAGSWCPLLLSESWPSLQETLPETW